MPQRLIQPVSDNIDKQRTYQTMLSRYRLAIKDGFYLEAILIDYAMLEDRLSSFLYHIALLQSRDSFKVDNEKVIPEVKTIVAEYKNKDENSSLSIKGISGKMKIVGCTLLWAITCEELPNSQYLEELKKQYENTLNVQDVLNKLDEITAWCAYRYEVIHALLNKNTRSLMEGLPWQAKRGMDLARFMDSQVKKLRAGNVIRRKLKLQS